MAKRPLTVAWISFFPLEWLPDAPEPLRHLPREHPAPWQRLLLDELKGRPELKLHVFSVRKFFPRSWSFEQDGVTFHCVKVPRLRTLSLYWGDTLALRRELRAVQPDLVHAWGSECAAALVASRLGYPYLVTMQGLLGWIKETVGLRPTQRMEGFLEPFGLRRASLVTAESNFAVQWLRERYPHLELRQIEHAPHWLFHRLERRPQTRPLELLYVGNFSRVKGVDLLLLGLDKLRAELDFKLTLVGPPAPAFLAQLKAATSTALWERIVVRHNLTQPEIAAEMARAALFVFPTRVDNSPNSVKEAVVAGVPVVASAVGGILDYVLPERNGLRFPAGELEAFVQAVRAAAAHPLFSRGEVELQTLRQMREYLSPQTMGERFLAAYQHVKREA